MSKPPPAPFSRLLGWSVLIALFGAGHANLHAQASDNLLITGWTKLAQAMELTLATEWGSRYRIESSTNLQSWDTLQITEAARETSLTVTVEAEPAPARFYRVSLFCWEEMKADLQSARQLWELQGWLNYQFEFRWICYNCLPDFTTWKRITVTDGAIAEVVEAGSGEAVPQERWPDYHTLAGLFDWIEAQLAECPEHVELQLDPTLGMPLSGFFDQSLLIADEEIGFQVRAFLPIEMIDNPGSGVTKADAEIVSGSGPRVSSGGEHRGDGVTPSREGLPCDSVRFRDESRMRLSGRRSHATKP